MFFSETLALSEWATGFVVYFSSRPQLFISNHLNNQRDRTKTALVKIELLSKQCRATANPKSRVEWSRWPEWSGVCDPDPFSLNPQTECGIHSSVMLAIYILAEEGAERRREHFQFVIRRFPKKKRGKEKEYFIFAASLGTTL